MFDNCPICGRPNADGSQFCILHDAANKGLEGAYAAWTKSYSGRLSQQEYFDRLEKLSETGQAVKEMIHHIRAKGAKAQ
jgi:hypothetical protein